jgi:hypothetical protein
MIEGAKWRRSFSVGWRQVEEVFLGDITFDLAQVRTAEASASGLWVCQSQQDVSAMAK